MKRMKKLLMAFLIIPMMALVSLSTSCSDDNYLNVVDLMADNSDLDTFLDLLETVDFDDVLRGEGPYTVFAPNDPAFANLIPGQLEDLLNDLDTLSFVLATHIVNEDLDIEDLIAIADTTGVVVNINNEPLSVEFDGDFVFIGGAAIVQANGFADNGVVHVIDAVLGL